MRYEIYCDGELIREGTSAELARSFGVTRETISIHAKDKTLFKKRYEIKHSTKKTNKFDYVERNIRAYGNAFVSVEPTKIIEDLKSKGIMVTSRVIKDGKRLDWILEEAR